MSFIIILIGKNPLVSMVHTKDISALLRFNIDNLRSRSSH